MDTRKIVSLPAELAQRVEDFRFGRRMKTEAEALRRLIEIGLDQEEKAQPKREPAEPGQ
ncbi:MAG TPA: hypothetical protein PKA13_21570 [Geminicoccaceae bacterium]|nr:hypothetical protein [Geminicoccus sp.]HMU52384.1 hypothetical protein [Geminicoccaceae bacterium]